MDTSKTVKIGKILIKKHFCTLEQVIYAIKIQQDCPTKNLGTILLDLAYITKDQLKEALEEQRKSSFNLQKSQH